MCNALLARKHTQTSTRSQFDSPARLVTLNPRSETRGWWRWRKNAAKPQKTRKILQSNDWTSSSKEKKNTCWMAIQSCPIFLNNWVLFMVFTCQLVQNPLPPSTIIIAAEDTSRVRHPFELSEANCRRKASTLNEFHARGRASWNTTFRKILVSLHHCILFGRSWTKCSSQNLQSGRSRHDYNIKQRSSNPVVSPFF